MNICPICHLKPLRKTTTLGIFGDCCLVCHRDRKAKKKSTEIVNTCEICNELFRTFNACDVECSNCFESRNIRKSNEKWLVKKPKVKNKIDSKKVSFAFFGKKYSVGNLTCRG